MSELRIGDLAVIIRSRRNPDDVGRTVQIEALFPPEQFARMEYDGDVFASDKPEPHAGVVLCHGAFTSNCTVAGKALLDAPRAVFRVSSLRRIGPKGLPVAERRREELPA